MAEQKIPYLTPQAFRCRSMLESFRLGIVPHRRVEEFTFGRDVEIAIINRWLSSYDIATLLVRGAYGSGKSHLLEYIYSLAFSQGYAVASASIDPNEAPLSRPKAVYRRLIQSFRYREGNSSRGLRDFLRTSTKRIIENGYQCGSWIDIATRKLGTPEEEFFWNWIEGRGYYFPYWAPTLYDHGTAANIYCNILSGLGWMAASVLELKGLVIILDEAENVDQRFYYQYQVEKGSNFIRGLTLVASDESDLLDERILRAEHRPGIGTCFGEKTDLIYHGFNQIRYCHQLPSFLKVAFAFSTEYAESDVLGLSGVPIYDILLEELSEESLREIFDHICLLYNSAYDFPKAVSDTSRCFEIVRGRARIGNRSFIKGSVEIHDLRRFHPSLPIEQLV